MGVNTLETLLFNIGHNAEVRTEFTQDSERVLARYPLSDDEKRYVKEWDLKSMVALGINPMVLMYAYVGVHGGPVAARDQYIRILNSPTPGDAD